MKRSEVLDCAMRGVIELMNQEQDEEKRMELNIALKELAMMFVLAEREEGKQQFYTCGRYNRLQGFLGALKAIDNKTTIFQKLTFQKNFDIIYI